MNPELESRWQQLQDAKQTIEAIIKNATCDPHCQPTGAWSMAQVIEHLLASEGGTLNYMRKKSSSGWESLEEATAEHHEKSRAINARLASDERYKAPDVLPEPVNAESIDALFQKWNALRDDLRAFLLTIDSAHFHKLVFRQPAAGMLTTLHALEFMEAHARHHIPQLERIQQA